MKPNVTPLPPESKTLIEQLIRERDVAIKQLDVAITATRMALGVPADWQIRNLDEGFVPVPTEGDNQ